MFTPSRALTTLAITGVLALTAACGSSEKTTTPETPKTSSTPTASSTPEAASVDITFAGDIVTPAGEKLTVKAGEELVLKVHADKPGELHLHSSPEQEIAYGMGDSEHTIKLDRPGVYELESHHLDKLVLQLEVR